MMERQQILATMGELKLIGLKGAFNEIIKVAVKRNPTNGNGAPQMRQCVEGTSWELLMLSLL
jgi:hypothetical protein